MGKDSITAGIVVGVTVGILLLIVGQPIREVITPPEAIPTAQYSEKFCPNVLTFPYWGDKAAQFSVKFQNLGDDGSLFVTLDSEQLFSRLDGDSSFIKNATRLWLVN